MATDFDSPFDYDVVGGYDDGPSVPVVVPTHSNSIRAPFAAGVGASNLVRERYKAAVSKQLPVQIGGSSSGYDSGASYDQGSPYDGDDGKVIPKSNSIRALWGVVSPRSSDVRLPDAAAASRSSTLRALWTAAAAYAIRTRLRFGDATKYLVDQLRSPWTHVDGREHATRVRWADADPREALWQLPWARVDGRSSYVRIRWRPGYPFRSGYTLPFNGDPAAPPGSTIEIPSLAVYAMTPSLTMIRTSDSADIKPIDCKIALEAGAWAWTLSATIPRQTLALVDPNTNDDPVLVQVTINGYVGNFLIETASDNRRFGGTGATITGRTRGALLSSTYAPKTTFASIEAKDISQLAADLMPGGWTLNWIAPDWLVPIGLFTYSELAPIDALSQLANSIGAIIIPDMATQTLTVQSAYPINPWAWSTSTPYASIPKEFITEIDGQWQGQFKSAYNGIWVSGQNGGVVGRVKRTGSDGNTLLPAQNDMLIVDAIAVLERGRVELAKADARKIETLYTPLLPAPTSDTNPGIFVPGQMIEITEPSPAIGGSAVSWFGQVMANELTVTHAAAPGSSMTVRQTLTVERHA